MRTAQTCTKYARHKKGQDTEDDLVIASPRRDPEKTYQTVPGLWRF